MNVITFVSRATCIFISHFSFVHYRNRNRDGVAEPGGEITPLHETKDNLIKRYAQMPIAKQASSTKTETGREMSKLESNLRRFEEERRRFQREKERFEREKSQIEQIRFQRLIEMERKQSAQRKQTDRRPTEVTPAASEREQLEKKARIQRFLARSRSKSRDREIMESIRLMNSSDSSQPVVRRRLRSTSKEKYCDDYESSTAISSSSRDADFDNESGGDADDRTPLLESRKAEVELEPPSVQEAQTLLSRLLFGARKPPCNPQQPAKVQSVATNRIRRPTPVIIDDGGPISIKRILFVETPIVWRQVLDDHAAEWEQNKRQRNRCIADFIALALFFGAGGLIFRFVEGAFENFYKCGVKRVKRDFVDQLWSSSHNLRFINFAFD